MKEIRLTQGYIAIVDDEDFERLSKQKWYPITGKYTVYAIRNGYRDGRRVTVYMHREIMDEPRDMQVDHRDHNGLHNWRGNLRVCTRAENAMNAKKRAGTSKYKGVCWSTNAGKWLAQAGGILSGKQAYLGLFDGEDEAALAYNKFVSEHFGEFAELNIIDTL